MASLHSVRIDVTKIRKDRLYEGEKGTYLDLIIEVKDQKDKYGHNVQAWESQTEEERKEKKDRNFLSVGGKTLWEGSSKKGGEKDEEKDDLPF